jgi:hypothetical protein
MGEGGLTVDIARAKDVVGEGVARERKARAGHGDAIVDIVADSVGGQGYGRRRRTLKTVTLAVMNDGRDDADGSPEDVNPGTLIVMDLGGKNVRGAGGGVDAVRRAGCDNDRIDGEIAPVVVKVSVAVIPPVTDRGVGNGA